MTTISVRQRVAPVTFVCLALWFMLYPHALALTGLVTLGSLLVFAFLWARSMAVNVVSRRALRYTAVQVGDELEEAITIDNRSRLPVVWAEMVDRSRLPGHTVAGINVVGGRRVEQRRASTICTRRGVFTLGPWELHMGDPFGLFDVRQVYDQPTEILVYPPLAVLPPDLQLHTRKIGDLRRSRHALAAETIDAGTTRPYLPSDARRHIHWRTTARQNRLFVKVFEPEASSAVWLVPDIEASVQVGEGGGSSFETMVVLLASLASQLLDERLAVGLLLDAPALEAIPPQPGQAHLWTILHTLALLQPVPGRPLAEALARARSLVSVRDSIVVVTPSLDPAWWRALKQLAGSSQPGGDDVILLDPASFDGDVLGEGSRSGEAQTFAVLLARQGISVHVVRRGDVRPIDGSYGRVRRWEFKTLGTGRVVVRQTPRQVQPTASLE